MSKPVLKVTGNILRIVSSKNSNYLQEEALGGGYETEVKYANQLNGVYGQLAQLINA